MYDQRFDKEENSIQRLMWQRLTGEKFSPENNTNMLPVSGVIHQYKTLEAAGGKWQQQRMIRDKRRSLDRAVLYSYQAAFIKKILSNDVQVMEGMDIHPVRALINPNKLKQDYDDKIVSVGYEFDFHPGDVFEWCDTGTYWLIVLQHVEEYAYFRGEIRKCCYQIDWLDEDGDKKSTYAAIRGPVETKINFIQKHKISVDEPNYSLNLLIPKNENTMHAFQRYKKFYLQGADDPDSKICWRVEATDSISTPGILEVVAVEYYANETEDDIENGLVGALIEPKQNLNIEAEEKVVYIVGESFIKPKKEYIYTLPAGLRGEWGIVEDRPVKIEILENEDDKARIKLKWESPYSGQFTLQYGKFKKVIVVESLF